MLAKYAGFSVIDADELLSFDADEFIRRHTAAALEKLRADGVPLLTANYSDFATYFPNVQLISP